jgi:hypothetical protein
MATLEEKLVIARTLLRAESYPDVPKAPWIRYRGPAAVALVFICGIQPGVLHRLRRKDWCPGGQKIVQVVAEDHYKDLYVGGARGRVVPILPAAEILVGRYLRAQTLEQGEDAPLLVGPNYEPILHATLRSQIHSALRKIHAPLTFSLAVMKSMFDSYFDQFNLMNWDRGLIEYARGRTRVWHSGAPDTGQPPIAEVKRMLELCHPLAKLDWSLWHKPRGSKEVVKG